jgi:hypothetical protein
MEFREENLDDPFDPWKQDLMQTKNTVLFAARGTREQYLRRRVLHDVTEYHMEAIYHHNVDDVDTPALETRDVIALDVDIQDDNVSAELIVSQRCCCTCTHVENLWPCLVRCRHASTRNEGCNSPQRHGCRHSGRQHSSANCKSTMLLRVYTCRKLTSMLSQA